jgi:hypothetical protein
MKNTCGNRKLNKPLSITIEYARNKIGERGKKMTDKQILDLLCMLRFICNKAIDGVIEEKAYHEN